MARFDIQVQPETPQQYLGYSKEIETPKPFAPVAEALEGISKGIEQGVKGFDTALKEHTEFLGSQMGEKEQEDFLTKVQSIDNLIQQKDNVPGQISQGLNFIARNEDAYKQGKLRETEYLRNLYEKAKSLRAQWPGYRDYIDRGVEKATGITPNANKLISSILQDINDKKSNQEKYHYELYSKASGLNAEGFPGMDKITNGLRDGTLSDADATIGINRATAIKYQHLVQTGQIQANTLAEGDAKLAQTKAIQHISSSAPDLYSSMLSGLTVDLGHGPEKVSDILADVASGKRQITDEQSRLITAYENSEYNKLQVYMNKVYSNVTIPGASSIQASAGDKYQETINKSTLHQSFQDSMVNKDYGFINRMDNMVKDKINNASYQTLTQEPYKSLFALGGAMHRVGGPNMIANSIVSSIISDAKLFNPDQSGLQTLLGILGSGQTFAGVNSLNDAIDVIRKDSGDGEGHPNPAAVDTMLRLVPAQITNPNVPDTAKINYIKSAFNPANPTDLGKIEMDYRAPDGRMIKGRYGAYEYFTSPGVSKEIKRLSDQYGPASMEAYRNWAEFAFSKDLFGQDLGTLGELQHQPNMNIRVVEKDGAPQFVLTRRDRFGKETPGTTLPGGVSDVLDRVNRGIAGLHNVYKETNDPERIKYTVLQMFVNAGINPNVGNSIARSMMNSLGAKPKEKKDESRAP